MLEAIGLALAGRAGSRLSDRIGVPVSRSSLLRLVRALPDPEPKPVTVLGIDDFALRRGHTYGTIMIDMDTHRPIDLIPGRDAEPVREWLQAHPGIQVVCRDRSSSYAEAVRSSLPEANQVADRFHLWQNLAVAVERCLMRHRTVLDQPQAPEPVEPEPAAAAEVAPESGPDDPTGKFADRARRRHAMVHGLLADGHSIRGIALHLGWGRHTVQRYARAEHWQELVKGWKPRASILDPYKPYLQDQWEAGRTHATELYTEIRAMGYPGSYVTVAAFLSQFRPAQRTSTPMAPPPLSMRTVIGWITRHPDSLDEDEKTQLKTILAHSPPIEAAYGLVKSFAEILTNLTGQHLPEWINAAIAADLPGITGFARGLTKDLDAVTAGLTLPYSSGAVEGGVNRLKMLKRQMFGRANLDLLRKRVILAR